MYWEALEDYNNTLIAKSMKRDTFDNIMCILHFANKLEINYERFYKIRPFFDRINAFCKHTSIDEIMIPYNGIHGDKQFIRGKPVYVLASICRVHVRLMGLYCTLSRIADVTLKYQIEALNIAQI